MIKYLLLACACNLSYYLLASSSAILSFSLSFSLSFFPAFFFSSFLLLIQQFYYENLNYIALQTFYYNHKQSNIQNLLISTMDQTRKTQKYRWCAIAFLTVVQLVLFASVGITVYALITLDIYLICFLLVVVVLQIPLGKVQSLVDSIVKYNHPSSYFDSFQIKQDAEVPPTQKCIFAFHPHSVYGMGILGSNNFPGKAHFSNMVVLSSDFALNMPFLGALLKIWGVGSASNSNVKKLMKQGKNIGVLPGGFQEATVTSPNQMRCWITQRKGFIKYALENNYKICPTIVLGEHKGFWTLQALENIRLLFNRIKIPSVFFWNRYSGIFLPTKMDITVITGKLIERKGKNISQPTKQQVNQMHSEYVQQIERLYNKYKSLNGNCALKFY